MNKEELSESVALELDTTITEGRNAVTAVINAIEKALQSGDSVKLMGFGTFLTHQRAARKAHNPKTGEPVNVPACMVPKFKPSEVLKNKLN